MERPSCSAQEIVEVRSLTSHWHRGDAQENFTDPDSRIMINEAGFQQCYNAQAAVDEGSQLLILA